ncbi:membrane protein [Acidobacteria bacterium Mor1]|nr:membrane protein [Acidobacteria bacterium Mor1]
MRTALLTLLALVSFAANSLLCRAALGDGEIDPASFTALRLVSGAALLFVIVRARGRSAVPEPGEAGSWLSAAALFAYAITFSLAYLSLDAGTGALILFGCVQLTMIGAGIAGGQRPSGTEWSGTLIALSGLAYLVSPGLTAPAPLGAALMALSGIAWGGYSLRGRGARFPVAATSGNFSRSVPPALVALAAVAAAQGLEASPRGAILALVSGAITSGLGYVLWYAALPSLTPTRAAVVQLMVPVIAGFGGVALLSEPLTLRLGLAAGLVLGGVGLAVGVRKRRS